ncbi:hypothetical protein L3Q82_019683 [Scortum barcoo]|uniref:Uncharacterized protein n=1 Tax=Scortum barcoo TaxID=214431 RepID=A0ACB8VC30_9TELE|nr:hypothetical protein L3Q82_019683 [Scortum barcoo]
MNHANNFEKTPAFHLDVLIGCELIMSSTHRWPRQMASSNGLCRYGARVDCCWGWTRRSWGHCQPPTAERMREKRGQTRLKVGESENPEVREKWFGEKELEKQLGICVTPELYVSLFALTHRVAGIRCQPQAVCQPGCKHGDCVGPNKCKCHPGFTGKTCNQATTFYLEESTGGVKQFAEDCFPDVHAAKEEAPEYLTPPVWASHLPIFLPVDHQPARVVMEDLNECGLKPRPCKHRCMNTYGSYKCYCLNGYMLMPDGTCGNARTCGMANCQYGCEVLKGEVRCQCPSPGLQLAPDGRTCVDVDECAAGIAVCPRFRKCINTFGSYICKCHEGFDLQYINGKYQCIDVDECSLGQSHCSAFATCYNTPGSYKCKCKDGYRGMGHDCKRLPHLRASRQFPPGSPLSQPRKPPAPTRKPYIPPRPVPPTRPPDQTPPPVTPVDNTIHKEVTKQRGDVHIPRNHGHNTVLGIDFDIELGNTADEAKDDPESGYLSCSFDDGLCGWIRDKDGDLHWETTPDPSGGRYLTIPEVGNKRTGRGARLVLPLTPPWNDGNLCLSFRHKLAGHHVGMLQVFVKKGKQYSPAVWGRTGGNGWRHTQITLWGTGLESVILKGERGRGRSGEMAVDDITLRKGSCAEEHNLRRL